MRGVVMCCAVFGLFGCSGQAQQPPVETKDPAAPGVVEAPKMSALWTQYLEARQTGGEPELADFSYAGYHCGDKPIPTPAWKVFNVSRAGAVPNDGKSDRKAFLLAIEAAERHGSGIIYFPAGRYRINEQDDPHNEPIIIRSSRIVLRGAGSGEGGTELYFDCHMDPTHPDKLWTCPYMIQFRGSGPAGKPVTVVADARRETFSVEVADASTFKPGDWVVLHLQDNTPESVAAAVAPHKVEPAWTALIEKGVMIDEFHCIASVEGNRITFREPIHADVNVSQGWTLQACRPLEEIGVEGISFIGNWHEEFVHHRNAIHDGGWSMLQLGRCVNSWVRDCRFTDVNRALTIGLSAGVTAENILIDGNRGHNAVHFNNTSHSIMRNVTDLAGTWHACGVAGKSSGNVILRCEYTADTCYESHASQPRWTLFDNVSGGWMYGRWGGAEHNQPNHLHGLVFWNYENTGRGEPGEFHFMRPDSKYGRTIMPYVIGFHGNPQAWVESEIKVLESNGVRVRPDSLYEAQVELRMKAGK